MAMDDEIETEETASFRAVNTFRRRPPSFFDALMSVSPPSPILTASLSATFTSEEIPVLLFDSPPSDSIIFDAASASMRRRSDCRTSLRIPSSSSSDTIGSVGTVGTFGQLRRTSAQSYRSTLTSCSEIEVEMDDQRLSISLEPQDRDDQKQHAGAFDAPNVEETSASSEVNKHVAAAVIADSYAARSSPPSPSPSVYSTLSCASVPHSGRAKVLLDPRPISYSDCAGLLHSSTSALFAAPNSPSVVPPTIEVPIGLSQFSLAPSFHYNPNQLPKSLSWLKDVTLEMLIDQEGFRAVTPKFRFAGYSAKTRALGSDGVVEEVVEFVPVLRQTFDFHWAPFEGQPVLRRLVIDGETRDYISRQATLSIKSNGVYTVCGSETSMLQTNHGKGTDSAKLRWKFDYFVGDRRGSKVLEGEKKLTPLTFSCSPLLLHPLQGRKIRLMHVVKKSVVTKLVAEKLEPPRSPSVPSTPLSAPATPCTTVPAPGVENRSPKSAHVRHSTHSPSPLSPRVMNDDPSRDDCRQRRASTGASLGSWNVKPLQYGHIIPPSKLAKLFDEASELSGVETALPDERTEIRALPPPPRNRQVKY